MQLSVHQWQAQNLEKQKLLLLHGMGGTGALWRPIAAGLEEDTSILAPDQRGHGQSQIPHSPGARHPVHYTPLDYGRDLVETLHHHHFYPCFVAGHSMGVRSACALAHLKPQYVKGLILIDLGFQGVAGGGLGENLAHFLKILPMQFQSRDEARQFMNDHCPDPSIAQYLMAVSVNRGKELTFPFDKGALIETIHAARDASVRGWVIEAGQKQIPVLVLRGAQSKVWSHEEFLKEQEHFKSFKSIWFEEIPNATHGLPFEQRPLFIKRLREFMTEAETPRHD